MSHKPKQAVYQIMFQYDVYSVNVLPGIYIVSHKPKQAVNQIKFQYDVYSVKQKNKIIYYHKIPSSVPLHHLWWKLCKNIPLWQSG